VRRPLRNLFHRLAGPVIYERVQFRRHAGYFPDLAAPRSLCEKLAWRKLYQPLPMAVEVSDKIAVRRIVAAIVGERYLNDALLITDRPDDIDLDCLPDAFVAKTNHGSGLNVIVPDKARLDEADFRRRLRRYLGWRMGVLRNEWWYDRIEPAVLIEPFLRDERYGVPLDFKVYVFHGEARFVEVHFDRFSWRHSLSLFDFDWRHVHSSPGGGLVDRPSRLEEIRDVAEALAADLDFVRIDLYCPNDERVLFGEITLTPGGGWSPFEPRAMDEYVGSFWRLDQSVRR
jgi:hypothetical protein